MARRGFFITGTDTGVGKTASTVALIAAAQRRGWTVQAMKPLASGCEMTPDGLRNEDALWLQRMQTGVSYEQINPFAFEPAIAPHIAAKEAGANLSLQRLSGFCRGMLMARADLVLIEGAGGWRVPINDREMLSQLAVELQLPVILVVALRLGCLSHARLTAEAIIRDGVKLAGWIGNRTDATSMAREAENIAMLRSLLPAPCLGILPFRVDGDLPALADHLSLDSLDVDASR